jgi:hypothetical protein
MWAVPAWAPNSARSCCRVQLLGPHKLGGAGLCDQLATGARRANTAVLVMRTALLTRPAVLPLSQQLGAFPLLVATVVLWLLYASSQECLDMLVPTYITDSHTLRCR